MTFPLQVFDVPTAELPRIVGILSRSGYAVAAVEAAPSQAPRYKVETVRKVRDASGLSDRELEVLVGMASGKPNAQIGRDLHLAEDTVKSHARRMFRKLGVHDRAHAVAVSYQRGILGGAQ